MWWLFCGAIINIIYMDFFSIRKFSWCSILHLIVKHSSCLLFGSTNFWGEGERWDRISLCRLAWPWIHRDTPVFICPVIGLKAHASKPGGFRVLKLFSSTTKNVCMTDIVLRLHLKPYLSLRKWRESYFPQKLTTGLKKRIKFPLKRNSQRSQMKRTLTAECLR